MRKMWFAGAAVLALAVVTFAGAPGVAAQAKGTRPTIALLDFDFGTVQQWWSGNWDIGKGISDMIVDELANRFATERARIASDAEAMLRDLAAKRIVEL